MRPDELREIADRLEVAQRQAETEAIDALTALVNGAAERLPPSPAGTPAPAAPPELQTCPACGKQLRRQGYGPHMAKKHGGYSISPKTQPLPIGRPDDVALQVRSWGE